MNNKDDVKRDFRSKSHKKSKSRSIKGNDRVPKDNIEEGFSKNGSCNWQKSRSNDPRWYSLNDQLLFDTANVPYSWPLGNRLNLGPYGSGLNNISLPGVMSFHLMPMIGISKDGNSPVNTAARNIYSFVRHANSGARNYDAPDLMMYLLAMDSLYSYISFLKRIYGTINTYNPENYYYPKAIVAAMNVDFDDIQQNLADFRAYINMLCVKVGSLCVPASMSYMAKHMWMYEGLYSDSPSSKAQTYLFAPYGFLKWGRNATSQASELSFIPMTGLSSGRLKRADLYNIAEELFNAVIIEEDVGIMSGDILKAFGKEAVFKLDLISETYTVLPSYDMEVLDQIQNMIMVGDLWSAQGSNNKGTVVVTQDTTVDTGYIISNPRFCYTDEIQDATYRPNGLNYLASNKIVTFQYDNVTTYNTMEATRMCTSIDPTTEEFDNKNQVWSWELVSCGSEVATFGRIYFFGLQNPTNPQPGAVLTLLNTEKFHTGHSISIDLSTGLSASIHRSNAVQVFNEYNFLLTMISQFDRHPAMVPVMNAYALSSEGGIADMSRSLTNGLMLDVDKYAILSPEVIANMDATALISQFNVRQYGLKDKMATQILV
nr:capsid protein [Rat picobirnavirus]